MVVRQSSAIIVVLGTSTYCCFANPNVRLLPTGRQRPSTIMSDVQGENEIITLAPTTDPNISTLTDSQESTMSILGAISGSLSILGSSLIVYRVYKNRHSTSPYDRIMLGLSICDIVSSFSFGLGPLLLPTDTSTRAWASGNERTCNFLGFLTQFSFCAVWYNGLLSLYYLMTVRFGVKRQVFAKKYEPYMHCLSLAFFLSTSISGLIIGLYSELEITQGCWIGQFPAGCEATDTCKGTTIGWIFAGLPFVVVYLGLPINNIVIFLFVRKRLGVTDPTTGEQRSPRNLREEEQCLRVNEVATQGLMYVIFFYVAYTPAFIIRVLEGLGLDGEAEEDIYPVLLLNSILLPLQGIFNVFIYVRPNYVRVRHAFPEQSRFWAIRHGLLETDIPALVSASRNLYSSRSSGATGKGNKNGPREQPARPANNSATRNRGSSAKSIGDLDVVEEDSQEDQDSDAFSLSFRKQTSKTTSILKKHGATEQDPEPVVSSDSSTGKPTNILSRFGSIRAPEPDVPPHDSTSNKPPAVLSRIGRIQAPEPDVSLGDFALDNAPTNDDHNNTRSSQGSSRLLRVNMDGTIT